MKHKCVQIGGGEEGAGGDYTGENILGKTQVGQKWSNEVVAGEKTSNGI